MEKQVIKKYVEDLQKKIHLFENTLNQYKRITQKEGRESQISYQVALAVMKSFEIVFEASGMSFLRYLNHHCKQRLSRFSILRKETFFQLAEKENLILNADTWKKSRDLNYKVTPDDYMNNFKQVLVIHESFIENLKYFLHKIKQKVQKTLSH